MNWYDYARQQVEGAIENHLPEQFLLPEELDDVERMVTTYTLHGEYHCMAHMYGVAAVAVELGARSRFSEDGLKALLVAGLFHDAGRRPIDDRINVQVASKIATAWIDGHMSFDTLLDRARFVIDVRNAIEGTVFPMERKPRTLYGRALRDADFAATLTPEPVVEQIRQALVAEMGGEKQTDYSFVVGQKAFLPATIEYYKQFGLDIEMIQG